MGRGGDIDLYPVIASQRVGESTSAVIFFFPLSKCAYLPAAWDAGKISCHRANQISRWAAFVLVSSLWLLCARAWAFSFPLLSVQLGFAAVEGAYRRRIYICLKRIELSSSQKWATDHKGWGILQEIFWWNWCILCAVHAYIYMLFFSCLLFLFSSK